MKNFFLLFCCLSLPLLIMGQEKSKKQDPLATQLAGLKFRSIGPAFMSGRIADIAIHPQDDNVWYIAVGSGGVWKTSNAGVTWSSIFDGQGSFSIGCVTIDQRNPNVIWVGTGENVGGRHVAYGDGVYRSRDGGKTWENLGLKKSEHISKIIVHPDNSDVVWVAAQGPLWSKGGERGLYKTTDGGKTWAKTLGDDQWTGVTDLLIDPRNPDQLYAATWDRHRTVAAYMGGGPGTAIHRSSDGGTTWEKCAAGLPVSMMGKIGLAISPQQPDVLYAAIELDRRTGGVYKSTDRGASWNKQSDAVSGATGPHYYQELYASPHQFDRLYLMDVRIQVSEDGGKTFRRMKEKDKHSDNHAIAFRADDPDYLLIGTDGGIYESFDGAENWRFMANLPLTQFYKVAVDDAKPFYNIYGGTQDNSTEGGPSRTDNIQGIQNSDWKVVLNWDGHQPATEPGNPNIMYAERQEGTLSRIDLKTGEVIDIQPQPAAEETYERYNWDAPILVSPHKPQRIYFASQRVWKSEDRGDNWTAISGDLTKNQNRLELPIMGKKQPWDAPWDFLAMSNYNTITSLAESPKEEGLLYAGTDDGAVQVSGDGGKNWRKIDVNKMPGVPATAFVNDIKADLFDASTVYVALDNHKYGDFQPYLVKSTDRGATWTSISGSLPDRTLVWRLVQDHVDKNLLFLGTEFGIYFSLNGGKKWTQFKGGLPTISFRDLAIQRRENDLIGASFGRGFYILDDYSVLRNVSEEILAQEAALFPVKDAWWYIPRSDLGFSPGAGSQGAAHYIAPNPDFGAVFTYHLKDSLKTTYQQRKEQEAMMIKKTQPVAFPGWETLEAERLEDEPVILFTIKNKAGEIVRRMEAPATKGMHRVAWDLRYPAPFAIALEDNASSNASEPSGLMAPPGDYTVSMSKRINGVSTELGTPQNFSVVPLREGTLPGADPQAMSAFNRAYEQLVRRYSTLSIRMQKTLKEAKAMQIALRRSTAPSGELDAQLYSTYAKLQKLDARLNGNPVQKQAGEKTNPTIGDRLFSVNIGISNATYGPTAMHQQSKTIIEKEIAGIEQELKMIKEKMGMMGQALIEAGAPWGL